MSEDRARRTTLPGLLVGLLALTGCTQSPQPHPQPTGSPTRSAVPQLIGYGATRERWDATHRALGNDRYGPFVSAASGSVPRYRLSASDDIVRVVYRTFPAGMAERAAVAAVVAQDLPPDAELTTSAGGRQCVSFRYSSAQLAASTDLRAGVLVLLYTTDPQNAAYRPDHTDEALLKPGEDTARC